MADLFLLSRVQMRRLGVFNKIFAELAGKGCKPERIMIDVLQRMNRL